MRDHPDQTPEERLDFVRNVILKDTKVLDTGTEKWRQVKKDYPRTRHEEFKAWEELVWTKWLIEKIKSVKRKQKRKRPEHEPRSVGGTTIGFMSSENSSNPKTSTETPTSCRTYTSHIDDMDDVTSEDGVSSQMVTRSPDINMAKRRRTENIFLNHTLLLMRDGYMAPDRVIELAQMVKAELVADVRVSPELDDSEMEKPGSPLPAAHGRHGRHPRVIAETPEPMSMDGPTSDGPSVTHIPGSSQPMDEIEPASHSSVQDVFSNAHCDGVNSESQGATVALGPEPIISDSTKPESARHSPSSHRARRWNVMDSPIEDPDYRPPTDDSNDEDPELHAEEGESEGWGTDEDEDDEPEEERTATTAGASVNAVSSGKIKSTTDVFWDDDVDLDGFYLGSDETAEMPTDFGRIAAEGIPDPGVELLNPQDDNVPHSPRLEAEDPAIELNLREAGMSDDYLRDKLYFHLRPH